MIRESCAWCHELNTLPPEGHKIYCSNCGHRVGVTRVHCDCQTCKQFPRFPATAPASERNSPESLQQRLKNSEGMLAAALNLIGAMQPVCDAADKFFDSYDTSDLTPLGTAVANYRDYKAQHATHDHVSSQRPGHDSLHGQTASA
jgi:hypothetical protein